MTMKMHKSNMYCLDDNTPVTECACDSPKSLPQSCPFWRDDNEEKLFVCSCCAVCTQECVMDRKLDGYPTGYVDE